MHFNLNLLLISDLLVERVLISCVAMCGLLVDFSINGRRRIVGTKIWDALEL